MDIYRAYELGYRHAQYGAPIAFRTTWFAMSEAQRNYYRAGSLNYYNPANHLDDKGNILPGHAAAYYTALTG
jgi:hypothetical protein